VLGVDVLNGENCHCRHPSWWGLGGSHALGNVVALRHAYNSYLFPVEGGRFVDVPETLKDNLRGLYHRVCKLLDRGASGHAVAVELGVFVCAEELNAGFPPYSVLDGIDQLVGDAENVT